MNTLPVRFGLAGLISGSLFTLINIIFVSSRAPYFSDGFGYFGGNGNFFTTFGSLWLIVPGLLFGVMVTLLCRNYFSKSFLQMARIALTIGYIIAYYTFVFLILNISELLSGLGNMTVTAIALFAAGFLASLFMGLMLFTSQMKKVIALSVLGGLISMVIIFFPPFTSVYNDNNNSGFDDNGAISIIYPVWQVLFGITAGYLLRKRINQK